MAEKLMDKSCADFTALLASRAPVPGGGGAAALVGAACGNVLETLDPAAPLWPAETDADGERIAVLARDLGFPDAAALRAACEALR